MGYQLIGRWTVQSCDGDPMSTCADLVQLHILRKSTTSTKCEGSAVRPRFECSTLPARAMQIGPKKKRAPSVVGVGYEGQE